jgi:hypothetical protein
MGTLLARAALLLVGALAVLALAVLVAYWHGYAQPTFSGPCK